MMAGSVFQGGKLGAADFFRLRAARVKSAARWRFEEAANVSGNCLERLMAPVTPWHRAQETDGVGMKRAGEERFFVGELDQGTRVHDADAIAQTRHHPQIVRDE